MPECARRVKSSCHDCPFEIKYHGPSGCRRKLTRVLSPWSFLRDGDPANPEYQKALERQAGQTSAITHDQQASTPEKVLAPYAALVDKVQQLTGLTQHLRNEVAELKQKKGRKDRLD